MNNQDINTEFSAFLTDFNKKNPSKRLSDLAAKRQIDLDKLNDSTLRNPEADSRAMGIWRDAQRDLRKLNNPMSNTLWYLAYKYFHDELDGITDDAEKKEAISDLCGLPENRIDAENELKEIIKEKICEKEVTINGNTWSLFTEEDAENKTPDELCAELDKRMKEMSVIFDEDAEDRNTYNEIQKNHTFEDFFRALAAFLNMKVGEILKSGKMNTFNFSYNDKDTCVIGKHHSGLEVITITPDISDEDDTGPTDDLICDIDVAGLGLPKYHPSYEDTKDMMEVLSYINRHRTYSPGDDGQYTIPGVKGSEVPAIVYDAVQDWQATASACKTVAMAWTDAHELIGDSKMNEFKSDVNQTKFYRDRANVKDPSYDMDEYYKNQEAEREARSELVEPKIDDKGNYNDDDISHVFKQLQITLGGKTADGDIFTDDELDSIADVDDGEPDEEPDDRV